MQPGQFLVHPGAYLFVKAVGRRQSTADHRLDPLHSALEAALSVGEIQPTANHLPNLFHPDLEAALSVGKN